MQEKLPTLPKKFVQALEALLYICTHSGVHPISGKEICEHSGLPKRHFEPLLQKLVHQKILKGIRGPHGGYSLAIERRRLTLADLFQAVCLTEDKEKTKDNEHFTPILSSVIKSLWNEMELSIIARLQTVTLEDLCNQVKQQQDIGQVSGTKNSDFTI